MSGLFPEFVSADEELNITYRYRCELYGRHIKQTPAGRVITEFLQDVPWAGIYNTINCAAMHHFREGRWMKEPAVLEEYAAFWCTTGDARMYSFPLAESVLALEKVTGDRRTADALYPQMVANHAAWDDHKTACGLYWQSCGRDGMEFSISGDGLRPTINSYMAAEKAALSRLAHRAGDTVRAAEYAAQAQMLRDTINDRLWNETAGMYGVVADDGEMQNVRELVGYIPWIYGIPPKGRGGCFRYLLDEKCFYAPCGLRTVDASHPDYRKPFAHECLWNGPVWPFATAQTLTALIEYLHTEAAPGVSAADFTKLLRQYAASHRDEDGTPWLDENLDPDTGIWLARSILRSWNRGDQERGCHYNHSTFIDLVMTGICGIRSAEGDHLVIHPLGTSLAHFSLHGVCYHGHRLDMEWKNTEGLTVTVDGARHFACAAQPEICIEIDL